MSTQVLDDLPDSPPALLDPDTSSSEDEGGGVGLSRPGAPRMSTNSSHSVSMESDDDEDAAPPPLINPGSSSEDSDNEDERPRVAIRRRGGGAPSLPRSEGGAGQASRSGHPNTNRRGNAAGVEPIMQQHFVFSVPGGGWAGGGAEMGMLGEAFMEVPGFPGDSLDRDVESLFFGEGLLRAGLPPFMQMLTGYGLGDPLRQVLHASFMAQQRGKPPASSAAMETLAYIQVREGEEIECPIESENIAVGCWAARMPCGHWFSSESLLKWLASQNSCPTCRYEMHTSDDDYNAQHNLTLETSLRLSQEASKNPSDFIAKRLSKAREESVLDDIAEVAYSELSGTKITGHAHGCDDRALDCVMDDVMDEMFNDGLVE